MRKNVLALLVLFAPLLTFGCDEETEETAVDETPIVGVMELPVSLRNTAAAPTNAVQIEVSPTEIRMDHRPIVTLERGIVPAAARANDVIGALEDAVASGAARRSAMLEIHVNTPWETTALVLASLKRANINEIAFKVRKPGGSPDIGYLVITDYRVEAATSDPVEVQPAAQRGWGEMVAVWDEAYQGCRRDHYVDCTHAPIVAAQGGKLELRFFARGSALKAEFRRINADPSDDPTPHAAPQMLEGIAAPAQPTEEAPTPVEAGAFTWRFDAAVDELSPISAAFRPLCGPRPCGIILTSDPDTMTMRLISMVGAAFPDGSSAPSIVVHVPAPR